MYSATSAQLDSLTLKEEKPGCQENNFKSAEVSKNHLNELPLRCWTGYEMLIFGFRAQNNMIKATKGILHDILRLSSPAETCLWLWPIDYHGLKSEADRRELEESDRSLRADKEMDLLI
jgi:hypothetical protein